MKDKKIYFNYTSLLMLLVLFMQGCKKEEYALPVSKDMLQNDCIKRTQGPNIVGQNIEFAYAMAILPEKGKLVSAQVEASIAGAPPTFLEHKSFYTENNGVDNGIVVGEPSVNQNATTLVKFNKDTSAATLRYYYSIPEEARGKTVSFTFSAQSSNGEKVSYKMGPYSIAKMDMAKDITIKDGSTCYISISDMAVYDATDAAANAAKVDLVYLYRSISGLNFNHALVSPGADAQYLPGVTLPDGVKNSTLMRKEFNLQDYNLAQLEYGIYIDDLDFQQLDLSASPNYAINMKAEAGLWVQTSDGKYKAYIFINSVNNSKKSAVISIKRYALK